MGRMARYYSEGYHAAERDIADILAQTFTCRQCPVFDACTNGVNGSCYGAWRKFITEKLEELHK